MALSTNLISGLSSGFDWRSMIDQLIAIDHQRVDLVTAKKTETEKKLTEWQSFNTKLLALKTAGEGLKDPEDFSVYKTSLSTDSSTVKASDLLSATTGTTASPGSYTIKITNLAQAQKLSSNPFTSKTAALGGHYAGDIVINGKTATINAMDSLTDVAYTINNLNTGSDPSGVVATIVSYGTNDYRLVLTSSRTGEDGISLLNGSSADLVQRFGWKDNQAPTVKNAITLGVQSDHLSSANTAVKSLLGLTTGELGDVTIGDRTVRINLTTMSLTDIKNAINDALPTGVTASIVAEMADGSTFYRLQIDGTQTFVDAGNILNTLGILDHGSADVSGKVSGNTLTSNGSNITPDTLLKKIDGYHTFTAGGFPGGDYITLSGFDTNNVAVSSNFSIGSSTTIQDLLNEIETRYGNVLAYVTADGKIRVDDLSGGGSLAVKLTDHLQDAGSRLEFVDGDADFGAAPDRKREIIAGEDARIEIDGVEVTRKENTINDVINGVTLNLVKEDAGTTVTLQVDHDTAAIKSKIQTFVSNYNAVMSYINTQFSYDEKNSSTGGVLFGDGTLSSIKSEISSRIIEPIWGVNKNFSILGLAGINLDSNILLSIDDTKLDGYLKTNFNDVLALFTGQGTTSNSTLAYIGYAKDTKAGDYAVHVSRAATQAVAAGNADLAGGGAADTLTVTQGSDVAKVTITPDMTLDDIINELNTEFDAEYARTIVGDQLLKKGDNVTAVTADTAWNDLFGTTLQNGDTISFTGTSRGGTAVSGNYTISNVGTDTIQGLLSEIESAFSNEVTATIDTSGRLVLTDNTNGTSAITLAVTGPAGRGLDFGTIDITDGAGDGSREGRYRLSLTATDDGSNHLVIRHDDYGSAGFTISQDTSDNNYDHILYTATGNTTAASSGTVFITPSTTWSDIQGGGVTNGDTITIAGKARDGSTDISGTYTIGNQATDTVDGLLTAIENAYSVQGTTVEAFIRDGRITIEDKAAGASAITLTLTYNGTGGLNLGAFDETTRRDLDLGLIDGTYTGQDVAGTIGGEAATGLGQILTGVKGNAKTTGLSVRYTGTSDNTDAGMVKLTLGFAALLDRTLYSITDPLEGYEAFKQTSLQNSIDGYATQIEQMEAFLDRKTEAMVNRFVAMETALNKIQNQSSWLSSQLSSLSSG